MPKSTTTDRIRQEPELSEAADGYLPMQTPLFAVESIEIPRNFAYVRDLRELDRDRVLFSCAAAWVLDFFLAGCGDRTRFFRFPVA